MRRTILLAGVLLALAPGLARAEILPSFWLDDLAWRATDVVVVAEGETIDGRVEVLERVTGDLEPGARLELPDLAAFASAESRVLDGRLWTKREGDPDRVTGDRMLLFLVRSDGEDGPRWKPAAEWGGMRVSVAWIEDGHAYGFVQVMNPGPLALVRLRASPAQLRERAVETARVRAELDAIAAVEDPAERARRAAPLTRAAPEGARRRAFEILAGAGPAALPVLRAMLADDSRLADHPHVLETLAKAGGKAAVPDLVAVVAEETALWRERAPGLDRGWWNGKGLAREDVQPLRTRYSRLYAALRALEERPDDRARDAVTALRDFWRSLPQLEDRSGLDQMSEACDRILVAIEE